MFVSIVIPVYNAAAFLSRCLESIISQWDKDTEVILVNDGSKDNSLAVCKEYACRYSNIFVVDQKNQGVGAARNHGIEVAQGEYIMLMDADDFYNDNSLQKLFQIMRDHDDVDVFRFGSLYAHQYRPNMDVEATVAFEGSAYEHLIKGGLVAFCWSLVYRKSFLDNHKLSFSSYILGEDMLFTSQVLFCNPRVLNISMPLYMYDFRPGSTTNTRTKEHEQKGAWDYTRAMQTIVDDAAKADLPGKVMEAVRKSLNTNMYPVFFLFFYAQFSYKEFKQILSECLKYNFVPVSGKGIRAWIINNVTKHPILYKPVMLVFNKIVVPLHRVFGKKP